MLLRYFHIPGQDLVWRWVLPGPTALEGAESTQGKCSASAALHLGRRRNTNECFGAYGHEFTWEEMKWLVDWCFVRGVNQLTPHAFYYSVRGPRRDERPPQVGPHSPWWDTYKAFADYCRRLSWLNTDSTHICHVAILTESAGLPWPAAKICFERQRDFNYLELRHLWEDANVSDGGVRIAGMHYRAIIVDGLGAVPDEATGALNRLNDAGRLIAWGDKEIAGLANPVCRPTTPDALVEAIDRLTSPDLTVSSDVPDLRYRHVTKDDVHYYMLWNEGTVPLQTQITVATLGSAWWVDPYAGTETQIITPAGYNAYDLDLPSYTTGAPQMLRLLRIT